jgi:hypothetical protein
VPGGCRRETAPLLSTRETVRRRRERSGAPTRIIGRMAQDRLFSGHQTCWLAAAVQCPSTPSRAPLCRCRAHRFRGDLTPKCLLVASAIWLGLAMNWRRRARGMARTR